MKIAEHIQRKVDLYLNTFLHVMIIAMIILRGVKIITK